VVASDDSVMNGFGTKLVYTSCMYFIRLRIIAKLGDACTLLIL